MTDVDAMPWSRTLSLIGEHGMARLGAAQVLVVGLGGVGGHAVEALARAGIGALTVVDGDVIEPSNLNRQLLARHSTLGRPKVAAMAEHLADIAPHCRVRAIEQFVRPEDMPALVVPEYTAVLDAIDQVASKVALLAAALRAGVPVFSSMGAGGRLDPLRLRCGDLMETRDCGLARAVRQRLRRLGYGPGVMAVWSDEPPRRPVRLPCAPRPSPGTISYLPALFGLTLAGCLLQSVLAVSTADNAAV